MSNYQVLFNGEVVETANTDRVRANLARELGLDDRKARQLFSGRTVVIRSQLEHHEAQAWQERLASLGAVCRIKSLAPKEAQGGFRDAMREHPERTLRDITAAHLECPRCGHMQLDASHCARCGIDLERVFRQQRKEDMLIQKKLRELRSQRVVPPQAQNASAPERSAERPRSGQATNGAGAEPRVTRAPATSSAVRQGAGQPQQLRSERKPGANDAKGKKGVLHWLKRG